MDHTTILSLVISALATLVTAFFTGSLAKISRQQAKILQNSIEISQVAAETANKSMQTLERAYVFLAVNEITASFLPMHSIEPNTLPASSTKFCFHNHGRTPAIVEEISAICAFYNLNMSPQEADRVTVQIAPGFIISPKASSLPFEVRWSLTHTEHGNVQTEKGAIFFSGALRYKDVFGIIHKTSFHMYWNNKENRFVQSNNRELNYFD